MNGIMNKRDPIIPLPPTNITLGLGGKMLGTKYPHEVKIAIVFLKTFLKRNFISIAKCFWDFILNFAPSCSLENFM